MREFTSSMTVLDFKRGCCVYCIEMCIQIEPKRAAAFVNGYGARVNFTFVQPSPFHPTNTFIVGRKLASPAGDFHVPKVPRMRIDDPVCSATGGHWNPYQVNMAEYSGQRLGTDDQHELGDLSGKYGKFTGLDNVTSDYFDSNLPLFGYSSVVGRSIVIHSEATYKLESHPLKQF